MNPLAFVKHRPRPEATTQHARPGMAPALNERTTLLVVIALLVATDVLLLNVGLAARPLTLLLYFVPAVLAALLLDRRALVATVGQTVVFVAAMPALQQLGWLPAAVNGVRAEWAMAAEFAIVFVIVGFLLERFGLAFQATLRRALAQEREIASANSERLKAQTALEERQRFTDAVLENLPGAFYVIDEQGRYKDWNRAIRTTMGYTGEELAELGPADLVVEEDREELMAKMAAVFEGENSTAVVTMLAKDGRRVPYLVNGTLVSLDGRTYLAGVGLDRSELDAAQRRVEALNDQLAVRLQRQDALRQIERSILESDLAVTLDAIVDQAAICLDVDAACLLHYEADSRTLSFGASRGFEGDDPVLGEIRLDEGLAGHAALLRMQLQLDDPEDVARSFGPRGAVPDGFHSCLAVPLIAKGAVQGVLQIFRRSSMPSDADWNEFLEVLAAQAAIAIENAELLEDLDRTNSELLTAYDTTIEGWAHALDLRDEETAGHSQRVTELALKLAERLGMRGDELLHLRRGALLHDIGKMGVPDEILLKPGKLTDEEWVIMKRHTTLAHELLAKVPFLAPALDIPYSHHERWDGTGYPQGLKETQIPLAARIFAVVDVYDALTSDRPYRAAWNHADALEHIRKGAGTHFDPEVVPAFLAMMQASGLARVPAAAAPTGENVAA